LAGMAIGNASVGINHAFAHALGGTFDVAHGKANSVFLLTTIAFNAQIPRKFMCMSSYPLWVADQKYARAAQFLNLPISRENGSISQNAQIADPVKRAALVLALRQAVYDLLELAGQPKSVGELGISEDAYSAALPQLIQLTFDDMSLRTNPSCPLIDEVTVLMAEAFATPSRPTA